jgi:hypothetical protein
MSLLFIFPVAYADSPTAEDFAGRIDTEVPQSSGFALLGVSPDKVIEPSSGRDFSVALLQGFDENGNFQSGFAVETRPYSWGQDEYISEQSEKERILSGFKLTLASTAAVSDEDNANRYGLGLNWAYRFNDPMFNEEYKSCVKSVNSDPRLNIPGKDPASKLEQVNIIKNGVSECQKKHITWAISALAIGVAAHKGNDETLNISESGWGTWVTGTYAITNNSEITGHLRMVDNQLSVVDDVLSQADSKIAAIRFRYGTSNIRGIFEASWNDVETKTSSNEYTLAMVGSEFKISDDMWFRIAYGDTFGSSNESSEFFTGQLRMGFGDKPVSKP